MDISTLRAGAHLSSHFYGCGSCEFSPFFSFHLPSPIFSSAPMTIHLSAQHLSNGVGNSDSLFLINLTPASRTFLGEKKVDFSTVFTLIGSLSEYYGSKTQFRNP